MLSLPTTNFKIIWVDEYEIQAMYVSNNPSSSRMIAFNRAKASAKEPTTTYTYLVTTMSEPEVALQRYDSDIAHNPNNPIALYNRAILKHEALGDSSGAQQDLDIALKLEPSLLLSLESRNSASNTLGSEVGKAPLIYFENKSSYTWCDYYNYHYLLAAQADIKSPIMQYTFQQNLALR